MMPPDPILQVRDLVVEFRQGGALGVLLPGRKRAHRALDGVSFDLLPGETLGIVGESGSGKTTVGRAVLRMQHAAAGRIVFEGTDITALPRRALTKLRRRMQMVFQDPLASLNPRHTVATSLAAPLRVHRLCPRADIRSQVERMLARVGLPPAFADRYPHELSGGQVQRVAIGRALLLSPSLLLADEAVSKLDVSVRAQILNLFRDLQDELHLAVIFITHDLHVARYLCDRILVMYFGQVVEQGPPDVLSLQPRHPYTRALLGTDPAVSARPPTEGPPDLHAAACRYYGSCQLREDRCRTEKPPMEAVSAHHHVACWADNRMSSAKGRTTPCC